MTERQQYKIYEQVMSVPHRDIGGMVSSLRQAIIDDPFFGPRCCVYLATTSSINDQVDAATAVLLNSPVEVPGLEGDPYVFDKIDGLAEPRMAGVALLCSDIYRTENLNGFRAIPPFRKLRIFRHLYGNTPRPKRLLDRVSKDWLREICNNTERFDDIVMRNRDDIEWLYKASHAPQPKHAELVLRNDPPPESRFYKIKKVLGIKDLNERAVFVMDLIEKHSLSYQVVTTLMPGKEPVSLLVQIEAMTPNEARNAIKRLEETGILQNEEVANAFAAKVKRSDSAASLSHRKSSQASSEAMKKVVEETVDKAAKAPAGKSIKGKTLLMIDQSSSMTGAILMSKEVVSRIVPLLDNPKDDLAITVFNTRGRLIQPREYSVSGINRELDSVRAMGGTAMIAGLAAAGNFNYDRCIIVTDGQEMSPYTGAFADAYKNNDAAALMAPITVIGVGNYDRGFTLGLEHAGQVVEELIYKGDYYILDNLHAMLSRKPGRTIVDDIIDIELPYVIR